jgi:mannose/fructose/N-acetylgalactosamine-specific phosphotransferase system component IIC
MTTVLDDVQTVYVIGAALALFLLGVIAVGTWRR